MLVVFRADASIQIGTGHVMRCVTLAEALRALGHECIFICRNHPGNLAALIAKRGFELHLLNQKLPADQVADGDGVRLPEHAGWLGTSWQRDAAQTIKALNGKLIDWLVVDHYALDARWEHRMATEVSDVMVIDDLADRRHECKLLLDQNLGRKAQDYSSLVPGSCARLIGPLYALLRPEFAELRKNSLARRHASELKRILITLGGVDRDNVTGQVLDALAHSQLPPETELDIVMGVSAPALETVRRQASVLPFRTSVSVNVTDMAERMRVADLCIGAAGSTSWERCCLGLPTVLVVLAENQVAGAKALQASGAAIMIDDATNVEAALPIALVRLSDPNVLKQMSEAAADIVDGNGARSVAQVMSMGGRGS